MANIVICIGREFGSGGHEVAVQLGKILNLKVYDKEIIEKACTYGEIQQKLLEGSDEKATNSNLYTTVHEGNEHVQWGMPTSEVLFSLQSHEIRRIAMQENCIIVGRCADHLLRNTNASLLRVFITAPIEQRILRIMELKKMSYRRARSTVLRMDMQRRKYYEHYTGQAWGVSGKYDMLLDMGQMSIPQAAQKIAKRVKSL